MFQTAQIQEECDKREKENHKRADEFLNEFRSSCKNLGIDGCNETRGKNLRKQIIGLLDDLPTTYKKLADQSKALQPYR